MHAHGFAPATPRTQSLHDLARAPLARNAINHGVVGDNVHVSLGELNFIAPRGTALDAPSLYLAEALREYPELLRSANVVCLCAGYGAAGLAAAETARSVTLCETSDEALSVLFANASANSGWVVSSPHVALLAPGPAVAEDAKQVAKAFGPFDACVIDTIPSPEAAEGLAMLASSVLATPPGAGGGPAATREVKLLIAHRITLIDGEDEALATLLVNLPKGAFLDARVLKKATEAAFCVTSSPKRVDTTKISTPKLSAAPTDGEPLAGMPVLALAEGVPAEAPPAAPEPGASVTVAKHVCMEPLPPVEESLINLVQNPALTGHVVLVVARFLA